jgi:ABC-type xylose transport system permease subunit
MLLESALSRRFDEALAHGTLPREITRRGAMDNLVTTPSRTPAHLWAVGVIGVLWNSFGCVDYTLSKLHPASYSASVGMDAEAQAYMQAFPAWLTVFWALGVWGSLAGSILLLLRSRHAVPAFAISLTGLIVSQGFEYLSGSAPESMHTTAVVATSMVIGAALVFQLWYAARMKSAGVLR